MKKGVADGLQAHVNRVAALGSDRAAIAEQWLSSCLCRRCCDEGEGAMLPNCSKATHVLSVCASNPIVLSCLLKIDVDAAAPLIQHAPSTAAPTSSSALRLVSAEASSRVSSGSAEFDAACLEGGLLGGLVYEYVGAGGVGKSCWCYSAVAHILSSQDTGIVVWVDTEKKFSAQRWVSLPLSLSPSLPLPLSLSPYLTLSLSISLPLSLSPPLPLPPSPTLSLSLSPSLPLSFSPSLHLSLSHFRSLNPFLHSLIPSFPFLTLQGSFKLWTRTGRP
eukprot:GHVU01174135.1.p1 GENE.GHVU01174135.1~~GHVU01174135.1.p1  ORF type:complete len:276 (+),score=29.82 GHVU01174135.1:697-1524(+)